MRADRPGTAPAATGVPAAPRRRRPWDDRHLGFRLYLIACLLAGGVVIGRCLADAGVQGLAQLGPAGAVVVALLLLGELRPLVTAGADPNGIPISTAFVFALLLGWGLEPAVLAQAVSYLVADTLKRRPAWRTLFNIAQQTLSFGAAWCVLWLFGVGASGGAVVTMTPHVLLGVAAAVPAYFVVNELLVVRALSLHAGTPFRQQLREEMGYDALVTGSLLGLAPLIVIAAERGAVFVPLLLLPLGAVYRTASLSVQKERQAQHDALTGLPNRKLLQSRAEEALAGAARTGATVAFCLLDLDRFKEVNDSLGHPAGDQLLRHVANRLVSQVRPGDTVARFGGDEFGILLPHVADAAEASAIVRRVTAALETPLVVDGVRIDTQASAGIALHPAQAKDVATLVQRADVAMYVAKQRHSGVHLYDVAEDASSVARLGMVGELRRALVTEELLLHYQPKVALPGGEVVGVEALVRWQHPTRGLVAPDDFLPLAEASGLERLVTTRVLALALAQARVWHDLGLHLPVSVNVTAADLLDPDFLPELQAGLAEHGVAPAGLVLEITERGVLDDAPVAAATLAALARLGVGLSLDDFGTGYSSLAHLVRVPVTEVKIDRSFIANLGTDALATTVVRAVIDLGHGLCVQVVAEGVEDREAWETLTAMGCDQAQGWLVSRALPPAEATRWLRAAVLSGWESAGV
jgi:diguanylate cyclase (GGDEF)-like protein